MSEVFPTNARATGFGLASGTGRLGTAFIIPIILWIKMASGCGLCLVRLQPWSWSRRHSCRYSGRKRKAWHWMSLPAHRLSRKAKTDEKQRHA